jgi:hypothetical protein
MRRPNLIIARVGRQSLHSTWLNAAADRNWDLYLCPYQPLPGETDERLMQGDVLPGPKWTGLRELLESWDGWRAYERVWLPDDDLLASQDTINRFFDIAKAAGLELCAPALHENSYFAHFSTMRNRRSHVRRTGFVEIMAPCFSTRALSLLLPSLALSSTGGDGGWTRSGPGSSITRTSAWWMPRRCCTHGPWVRFAMPSWTGGCAPSPTPSWSVSPAARCTPPSPCWGRTLRRSTCPWSARAVRRCSVAWSASGRQCDGLPKPEQRQSAQAFTM